MKRLEVSLERKELKPGDRVKLPDDHHAFPGRPGAVVRVDYEKLVVYVLPDKKQA